MTFSRKDIIDELVREFGEKYRNEIENTINLDKYYRNLERFILNSFTVDYKNYVYFLDEDDAINFAVYLVIENLLADDSVLIYDICDKNYVKKYVNNLEDWDRDKLSWEEFITYSHNRPLPNTIYADIDYEGLAKEYVNDVGWHYALGFDNQIKRTDSGIIYVEDTE